MKSLLMMALAAAIAVPGLAQAENCHADKSNAHKSHSAAYSADYEHRTAVAGYNEMKDWDSEKMKEWDTEKKWDRPTTAEVDRARIAEYRSIFGSGGMVAGYSATAWRPWMNDGTWVSVDGERTWATQDNFVWVDNRWVWSDDDTASFYFEDDRFDVDRPDWGISVDSDRFDMDIDRDKLEIDPDRFNIDEDRLKIETDID